MKKSCRLSYIGLSLGIKNDRLIDFIINMFIALFKNLWQAFHILLYCFAGYFRNPELLITNYRWQKYTHSLHWFGSDIMRTLELHAYNLYMFNYAILIKNRKERNTTINLVWVLLAVLNLYPRKGMKWEVRRNFSHSDLSSHMLLREWVL